MPKSPYTVEQRTHAVKDYLNGNSSIEEICSDLGISSQETVRQWVLAYKIHGATAFLDRKSYSKEFKYKVVEEYLEGKNSLANLIAKYNISSTSLLRRWIKEYNSCNKLKDYNPKREVYMAAARRNTTIKERKEIVEYCIDHNRDYKGTASIYDVSYSQVYSWVKKYDTKREEGLTDKRGQRKADDEVDELERLRRENLRLKRQLEEQDMVVELLKKVKEFERM